MTTTDMTTIGWYMC